MQPATPGNCRHPFLFPPPPGCKFLVFLIEDVGKQNPKGLLPFPLETLKGTHATINGHNGDGDFSGFNYQKTKKINGTD